MFFLSVLYEEFRSIEVEINDFAFYGRERVSMRFILLRRIFEQIKNSYWKMKNVTNLCFKKLILK